MHLLKAAGFPTDAEYILHVVGPYSFDIARLTDEMARVGLLVETAQSGLRGETFDYRLADRSLERLREIEATTMGQQWVAEFATFEALVQKLAVVDLAELETAATIVYFRQSGQSLDEAYRKTCQFNRLHLDGLPALRARAIVIQFERALESLQISGPIV